MKFTIKPADGSLPVQSITYCSIKKEFGKKLFERNSVIDIKYVYSSLFLCYDERKQCVLGL